MTKKGKSDQRERTSRQVGHKNNGMRINKMAKEDKQEVKNKMMAKNGRETKTMERKSKMKQKAKAISEKERTQKSVTFCFEGCMRMKQPISSSISNVCSTKTISIWKTEVEAPAKETLLEEEGMEEEEGNRKGDDEGGAGRRGGADNAVVGGGHATSRSSSSNGLGMKGSE